MFYIETVARLMITPAFLVCASLVTGAGLVLIDEENEKEASKNEEGKKDDCEKSC